jgi:hypothetical protein
MAKKICAKVTSASGTLYRYYFQPTQDGDMVACWTKDYNAGLYRLERFGDTFNRDWVRKVFADSDSVVEF